MPNSSETGKLRVAVLSRKSKRESPENLSEAGQRELGRKWCAEHGHEMVWCDGDNESASGIVKEVNLPKRAEALRLYKEGKVDIIWVHRQDRLTREGPIELARLLIEGYRFFIYQKNLDTATLPDPNEDLVGCLTVLLEADANRKLPKQISTNVRLAKATMRDVGAWTTKAPYGTRVIGEKLDRRLTPDPETWPVIRRIYHDTAAGKSARLIAEELNAEGMSAPNGGAWGVSTINYVINNPVYEGWMTRTIGGRPRVYLNARGERVRCFAEGAETIPGELAMKTRNYRAEVARRDRRNISRGERTGNGTAAHLLTGFIHCAACGARMPKSGLGHVCGSKLQGRPCPAPASAMRESLESYVISEWVRYVTALDPGEEAHAVRLMAIMERWNALQRPQDDAQLATAQEHARVAERRLQRLRDDRDAGLFDGPGGADDYARRYREALAMWKTASDRIRELSGEIKLGEYDPEIILKAWDAADRRTRRDLLRLAIDRIIVTKAKRRGVPFVGEERVRIIWVGDVAE